MSRVVTLSLFFTRELFRSLLGIIPPLLTLALYQATFYYGGKVDYFASVGGVDLAIVAVVTSVLLADRANRAATYPLLARLPRRAELLAGLALSAFGVTVVLAVVFTLLVIVPGKASPSLVQMLLMMPRWVALYIFSIVFGLHLGKLVSRGGSYLIAYGVLALMLTVNDKNGFLPPLPGWFTGGIALIAWPVTTVVTSAVDDLSPLHYAFPLALTFVYAAAIFAVAARLFAHKDLLWAE